MGTLFIFIFGNLILTKLGSYHLPSFEVRFVDGRFFLVQSRRQPFDQKESNSSCRQLK
jgi:hypothetical protein